MFQSTHPRGVRLVQLGDAKPAAEFQSTHPRGVRRRSITLSSKSVSFNPRTREGCDVSATSARFCSAVSIHAPARGATHLDVSPPLRHQRFNPRTREGCDASRVKQAVRGYVSIHAPARGATHDLPTARRAPAFQSTHPRGVRHGCGHGWRQTSCVSIHAPARGATRLHKVPSQALRVSIHAPARGATTRLIYYTITKQSFNPRTREGCDLPVRSFLSVA